MPQLSFAPVRSAAVPVRTAAVTMTRARRRLRRRRARRAAIGSWWRTAKTRLGLQPPRRRVTESPILQIAAAVGAGSVVLVAMRRRMSRRSAYLEGRITGAVHELRPTEKAPEDDRTLADKVRTEIFRRRRLVAPDKTAADAQPTPHRTAGSPTLTSWTRSWP